jgi:hypothetical protein
MAKNRKNINKHVRTSNDVKSYDQVVMSAPSKIFVERYLSPKGKKLLAINPKNKKNIWDKYGKNRYKKNPDSIPCRNKIGGLKIIKHT